MGWPQVTLEAFKWSVLSITFWHFLWKAGRTVDVLLGDVASVGTSWWEALWWGIEGVV